MMTTTTDTRIHKFEAAGLGVAPFRCIAVRENKFALGDGTSKPGGTCDFCSTGIMWEFVILSSDGRKFVVGSDCVAKTGDSGLKSTTARMRRNYRTPEQIAAEAAAKAERDAFNLAQHLEQIAAREKRMQIAQAANAVLLSVYAELAVYGGDFIKDMYEQLQSRPFAEFSPRQKQCIADIYAKTFGRYNSKAYWAAYESVQPE